MDKSELLMEEDVNLADMEDAEQYARNLMDDNFNYEDVYFEVA